MAGLARNTHNAAASWSAVNTGLDSLTIRSLAVDPDDPQIVYAATASGVAVSTDGAFSWQSINQGLTIDDVNALAFASQPEGAIYAATEGAVFKSTDAGQSWQPRNRGFTRLALGAVAVDPNDSDTIYAGAVAGGVFKTSDGAESWTPSSIGLKTLNMNALAMDSSDSMVVYAGTASGFFKSVDGGNTWNLSDDGLTSFFVEAIVIDPSNPLTLYVGTVGGVFKSIDGGTSWTDSSTGLIDTFAQTLVIDPQNPLILYVGTEAGVFKSVDGATGWTEASNGVTNPIVLALAIDLVNPAILYAGTEDGVFKSVDGAVSWTAIGQGLADPLVRALAFDENHSSTLYAGGGSGVYRSRDGGSNWTVVNQGLSSPDLQTLIADPTDPTMLLAATAGGLFRFESVEYRLHFAQFGDGEGALFSQILLFNVGDGAEASIEMVLRDDSGQPLPVDINAAAVEGYLQAVIPPSGLRFFETDGEGPLVSGSATVFSDQALGGVILFGGSVGLAGVASGNELTGGFVAPIEVDLASGVNSGIAVYNLDTLTSVLDISLCDSSGNPVATTEVTVPGVGHLARFATELEWTPPVDFSSFLGQLKVSAATRLSATVIQTRPGEFATLPVVPKSFNEGQNNGPDNELHFAQFGEGEGGLFSQILLLNSAAADADATITIRDDLGMPLVVDLNGESLGGGTTVLGVMVESWV